MNQRHRVLGMLALLSIVTNLDCVCIAVAGPGMQDLTTVAATGQQLPAATGPRSSSWRQIVTPDIVVAGNARRRAS